MTARKAKKNSTATAIKKLMLQVIESNDKLKFEITSNSLKEYGWGDREANRLRMLDHFYRRIANLHLDHIPDQKKIDAVLEEYKHAVK